MRNLISLVVAVVLALTTLTALAPAATTPVVADVRAVGGLCVSGSICRTRTLVYADGRIVRDGAVLRRISAARVKELQRLIARIDLADVRAHPFTGTCPIAYDGAELVYRLRGVPAVLRSCTWDLSRVPVLKTLAGLVTG